MADHTTRQSFFVGGRYVQGEDRQHVMVGQMHVRRLGEGGGGPPVVLIHGGAQTGYHWEQTPDGRPGFADCLVALGRTAYVVDLPGIGRSRYHADLCGELSHYSTEVAESVFTATGTRGGWPGADLHSQWPGTGVRGDPAFDSYYASQVGHFTDFSVLEPAVRYAGGALVDAIGECHLVSHSQGGMLGWHIADERPAQVLSIVALEPKGPPYFDLGADTTGPPPRPFGPTVTPLTFDPPLPPGAESLPWTDEPSGAGFQQQEPSRHLPNLAEVPVLVVTAEASYHTTYDRRTVTFLRRAGVTVTHALLADHGIHGNGHLMALESNNDRIAAFVSRWLDDLDAGRRTGAG